jgi:hypothetical protein
LSFGQFIETDETRAEGAQRTKEKEKEVSALADKILSYGHGVHRRYPTGEVVVGEDDLAAQLECIAPDFRSGLTAREQAFPPPTDFLEAS